jgi:hypothetical protein
MEKKFAWYPVKVTSGRWTWLTTYYHHRSLYDETTGRPPLNSLYFVWTETASERTWRVLKESVVQNRNVWNTPDLTNKDNYGI